MSDGGQGRAGTATVVFTDLADSTILRTRLGDEAADELRREHDHALREAIEAHAGREVKHLGDGLMATFLSASDAVAAAVAMQCGVDRLARRRGEVLGLRVGVSAGDVAWEGDDCFGTPVIEGKRLCDASAPGEILVSEIVRLLAGSRSGHEFVAMGSVELKGMGDPVAAFRVPWSRGAISAVPLPDALSTDDTVAYVGRAGEQEALTTAWKAAASGDRRCVLLAGEPGIGKTRLAVELARSVHADGAVVLFGRCDEDLAVPYQPFAEALRTYAGAADASVLADQLGGTGADVVRLVPELLELVPGLGPSPQADPETERLRMFDSVSELIRTIGEESPVLLVLDDLHWAAKPTLLLLRHVLKTAASARLLIVGTYRDTDLDRSHPLSEVLADLRRVPGVERVALGGLDAGEVSALVAAAAGADVDDDLDDVVAAIHAETEGNPFFVGQVLRHLVESGAVEHRDGRWFRRRGVTVGIPEGVREVVGRRLGRLDDTANRVLAVASVIGREFELGLLEEIEGDSETVLDAIEAAETAHLVHAVPGRPGRWMFNHALVRSTLYDELPTTRRLRLHRDVGRALATRDAADSALLPELARHFGEAAALGETERAVEYGRRAASAAIASLAHEEAVAHLERVIEVLEVVEPPPLDIRAEVLCDLVEAAFGAGGTVAAGVALEDAVVAARAAERPDLLALATLRSTGPRTWAQPGIVDERVVELLEESLRLLPESDGVLRARAISRLSSELYFDVSALDRRLALAGDAVDMAERLGDEDTLGFVLSGVRWAKWNPDDLEGRLALDARILEVGRSAGNLQNELWGHLWLQVDHLEGGDVAGFARHRAEAARIAVSFGDRSMQWQAAASLPVVDLLEGDLERAEEHANEALAIGQLALPDAAMQIWGATIFTIRRLQDRVAEITPVVESMVETYPAVPAWRIALAFLRTETGDPAAALDALRPLGDECEPPRDSNWLIAQALLGYVAWRADSVALATGVHDRLGPHRGKLVWAGVPCTVLPPVDAFLAISSATAGAWDLVEGYLAAATADAERIGSPYLLAEISGLAAEVFARRNGPGDAGRARVLAERAVGLAQPRGLVKLVRNAEGVLDGLG